MKASKFEANYRDGKGDKRCENCTMFRPPSGCTAVQGTIREDMLCDFFNPKAEHDGGGN